MRSQRTSRTVLVAGLVLAALGVIVLILVGVPGFPLIPPGPIILLGAAALVAFVRWRWMPVVGLLAALFLAVGAVLAGFTQAMLATPSDTGPFVGSVIEVVGLVVAIVAGVVAVVRSVSRSAAQ
jgi:hypothetical protein